MRNAKIIAVAVAVALWPSLSFAQDPPAPEPGTTNVKVERDASGRKIIRITESIVVEGRIQKPNAFYLLQKSRIDYDWETLKQDFLPKIIEATKGAPF